MTVKIAESQLRTAFGVYREVLYYDGQKEIVAMVHGEVSGEEAVLCRLHSTCLYGHYFNSVECDCRAQMEAAQRTIEAEGRGIILLLDQEGKGNGHYALMRSKIFKKQGYAQADAYEVAGFRADARDFRPAAKVLHDLGVRSIVLLTDNPKKASELAERGVRVVNLG
jgi:GTP cyclohydrolase II